MTIGGVTGSYASTHILQVKIGGVTGKLCVYTFIACYDWWCHRLVVHLHILHGKISGVTGWCVSTHIQQVTIDCVTGGCASTHTTCEDKWGYMQGVCLYIYIM